MNGEEEHGPLFALSTDMLATLGFDGRIKTANPAWQKHLGYAPGELKSRPLLEIIHAEDHQHTAQALIKAACGEDGRACLVNRCLCRDGSHKRISWRLKASPERRLYYASASHVAPPGDLDLSLLQDHRLALIGRLALGVAHDFNNVLSVVSACAEMLDPPGSTAQQRQDLEDIKEASRRGAEIVQVLIDFCRRGNGPQNASTDISACLQNTERLLRRLLPKGIRLDISAVPGLARANICEGRLEQILLNLVVNSRDALPHGGRISMTAERARLDSDGAAAIAVDCAKITVADTGAGVPPEVQARMFEPFFTTKVDGKGTGLGLATVSDIIKDCGGLLRVLSRPGAGTSVEVFLPLAPTPSD